MAESMNTGLGAGTGETPAPASDSLVRASQVAREAEVRRSSNGVRFATFGETGVPGPDLDRMLEAVPDSIAGRLNTNTYFFVPLALREPDVAEASTRKSRGDSAEQAMVAPTWTEDLGDAAICHRNVELDKELGNGQRGVFISTRLMGDRFALSFEFFINVAHAFIDTAGVPERFGKLAWEQALSNVRGETSLDAWEARHLALGKSIAAETEVVPASGAGGRRGRLFGQGTPLANRSFGAVSPGSSNIGALNAGGPDSVADEKERQVFLESAFSDSLAIYLLSLVLDLDYSELRERDYPLLAPGALAERLKLVSELYPANAGYEFAVRYRRRA